MTGRVLVAGVLLLVISVVVVAASTVMLASQQRAATAAEQAGHVLQDAQLAEREVVDLETGLRGYQATNDRLFLAPLVQARAMLPAQLARLRRLAGAQGPKSRRAAELLANAVSTYIRGYIDPLSRPPAAPRRTLIAQTLLGKTLLDSLRGRFAVFDAFEYRRQSAWSSSAAASRRQAFLVGVAGTALRVLSICAFIGFVFSRVALPLRRAREAVAKLAEGDPGVTLDENAPGELGALARAFNSTAARLAEREQQLRESATERVAAEERLLQMFEEAPIGMALLDQDGRIAQANEAFARIAGTGRGILAGVEFASLVHPADAAHHDVALRGLQGGASAHLSIELRMLSGTPEAGVEIALHGTALRDRGAARSQVLYQVLDISARKRSEDQLQYLADHDALTGLYNRRRFVEELDRAVASERYATSGAVLMIDLDDFKYVNDTMGHSYGDRLVARAGSLLRGALRDTDVVARLGGDEFAVILRECDRAGGLAVAEKLLRALADRAVVVGDARYANLTASIGLATFESGAGLTAEELLVEADVAMYEAKESGKNRACAYDREAEARPHVFVRESWLERLTAALAHDQFELLAQPVRGLGASVLERYELLLRLRDPTGDLIPPGTFLYDAERFDLVQRIDRWVFGQALRLLRAHHSAGRDISLSVNMSGKTLGDPTILDDLTALVAEGPIPRNRLVVEVTETAAIVNIDRAGAVARGLRKLGCQFALDDFGAGFASFYYLKHLEFDFLKIDGEFIKSLTHNVTDELVVKSVVDIARALGAKTIAECIPNDATVARLRELGVDYGQGFHLGRPMPITALLPAPQLAA